ncbi:MAG: hypothetical protein HY736_25050, partial [Verrucomicrobia bacterium]|nr:hypothetical protein [Verrucomicrobiota bacterium]
MRLKFDGTWRRALQGACWFLALIASAAGQVLDTPLSVPVDIAGRFLAEPCIDEENYEPAYVSITTGAGSPVYWSSQDSGWIEGPWQLAMMIPGRTYLMTLSSDHAPSSEVHFIAPPGMRVLVDNIERQTQTFGSSATFKVRVEYANEPFAEPGVAPSLQPIDGGRIFWFVGMGRLKNGRSAGVITLAESSPYTSLGPNSFIYEQESTEVIQKPAAGSLPRQIHAPQCFVQIRNGSSSQPFVIEFYTRLQVGAYDPQTQHYAVSGEPFASYEITNAGYPFSSQSNSIWIARRLRQNGQVRSSTTYLLRIGTGYDEENDDNWESWEASPWNSGGGEKITASTHSNDGSEVIEYRDASWNVSKRIRKVYGNFLWGKELVQLTVGEGDSDPQTTTFAYHSTNPGQYGNYRRLKSVVLPTGNWTMFDYYDDLPRRGQIAHVYRPWLDVPAAPTANVNSGLVTTYTYTVDWTGKPVLPSTIETTANGSSFKTGRQEFAYANGTVDGLPVVTETRKDYSDATQYLQTGTTRFRADADAANHFYPGLLHSVRRPDGTMTVQLFQSGIFQIANRVLTPDANGLEWEHVVLEGTTSTKDTTALPAYFGLSTDANFRVMALRSSGASQVYSVNGVLISDRQSIYDGADWTTIGRNRRAYQDGVWPLWVSHDTGDPLTNWTVVANTWDRFQLKTSTDETGVSRQFGYDSFSDRLQKMTRDAAGPLSALPVSYSYNCSGQVTAERLGQEG